jgi:peptide/nickel transport system permease protein
MEEAKTNWLPAFLRGLLWLLVLTVLGGLLSATLVRYSPGYGVDERELDTRLSPSSVEAIRGANRYHSSLFVYYRHYFVSVVHGDFGTSDSLQRPIAYVLKERFPVTLRAVALGVLVAWAVALFFGICGEFVRGRLFDFTATASTGLLLSLPSAVVALLFVYLRGPVFLAIAVIIFPKLLRYVRNLFLSARTQPHVLAARSRGVHQFSLIVRHVIYPTAPALLALSGISVTLAFGAAVPIEALCDSAGIGQLAWYAALNRDLPLIMNLTFLVTWITVSANFIAEFAAKLVMRPA